MLYWIFQLLNNLKWKKLQLQSFRFHWALQLFGTWCASIWGCLKKTKVEFENSECLEHLLWPLNNLKYKIYQVQHFRSCRPLELWYKVSSSNFIWIFCVTPISKDELNYQPPLKINLYRQLAVISRDGQKHHPPLKIDDIYRECW